MKLKIIIITALVVLSSCSVTFYHSYNTSRDNDFIFQTGDTLVVFKAVHMDFALADFATKVMENTIIKDKRLVCVRYSKIDSLLRGNNFWGQPNDWTYEYLTALSKVLDYRYILRTTIVATEEVDLNDENPESHTQIVCGIYDLKKKSKVWDCSMGGDQTVFKTSFTAIHRGIEGEVYKLVEKIYEREITRLFEEPVPEKDIKSSDEPYDELYY